MALLVRRVGTHDPKSMVTTTLWTADTVVMPCSVSKPFAALCVLPRVERGHLRLDALLQDHWPETDTRVTVLF